MIYVTKIDKEGNSLLAETFDGTSKENKHTWSEVERARARAVCLSYGCTDGEQVIISDTEYVKPTTTETTSDTTVTDTTASE